MLHAPSRRRRTKSLRSPRSELVRWKNGGAASLAFALVFAPVLATALALALVPAFARVHSRAI
jgi:hypothetical protein